MWSSSPADDEKEVDKVFDVVEHQIADLTESCEPILTWDGVCGLVQVKDEGYVTGVAPPEIQKKEPTVQSKEVPKG